MWYTIKTHQKLLRYQRSEKHSLAYFQKFNFCPIDKIHVVNCHSYDQYSPVVLTVSCGKMASVDFFPDWLLSVLNVMFPFFGTGTTGLLPLVCILPVEKIPANLYFHCQNAHFHITRCNTYVCVSLSLASQKQKIPASWDLHAQNTPFHDIPFSIHVSNPAILAPPKQKYRLVGIDMLKIHFFTISNAIHMYPIMLFSAAPARRSSLSQPPL